MTDASSFDEFKDNDNTWIDLKCIRAVINEAACGLPYSETIDSNFFYECIVTGSENPPFFNTARVTISLTEEEVLDSHSGKYPFGSISIKDDLASIILQCTSKQIDRMVSNLNLLVGNHVGLTLTVPEFSSDLPKIIPILGYIYRAEVSTLS